MDGQSWKTDDAAVRRAFGAVLRRLRSVRCLTQEELAELGDCTTNYISLLERGIEGPSLIRIFDLALALQTTPHEMIAAVEAELKLAVGGDATRQTTDT